MLARIAVALLAGGAARALADPLDDPFTLYEVPSAGRTVAAELADFDGDGRVDLLQIMFDGVPPGETRTIRLWCQKEDGSLPATPTRELPVPADSAAYDVADITELPGTELVLLRPRGLSVLSFASAALAQRDLDVDGATLVPSEDERGLDRLQLVYTQLGPEPRLMVPMLAQTLFITPSGEVRARLDVGARANYFVAPRPGPLLVDSDIQLLLDVPRISVGDVDGDGRADVVGSGRHGVRVFLQREDGSFPRAADRSYELGLISEKDHIRGSGAVRSEARDVSGDGKLDLLVSHLSGGITDAVNETRIHLNRAGQWNLAQPDFVLAGGSGWGADQLIDVDNDGKPELMHIAIPFSVLELVEALITRAVDADIAVYRADGEGGFAKEPWFERRLEIPISFETGRPLGFLPTGGVDVNGDGFGDLLTPGNADRIAVYLGGRDGISTREAARQAVPSDGRLRAGDWNGDGLADLVLYDPRNPGTPVRIARNKGLLPGTLPHISSDGGAAAPKRP